MKLILITSLLLISIGSFAQEKINQTGFVGYQACTECHQEEVKQWKTSHHNPTS